jgi:RND family efflux transporter MFP subunit
VKLYDVPEPGARMELSFPGQVQADKEVYVSFEVTGKLQELPVQKGQHVRRGDLLARLDPRDFENELLAAEAVADEAASTLERFEAAAAKNALAIQEVDEQRARLKTAEAEVRIRQKALDDTRIIADFDGVIASRFFDNFQNVVAKDPVVVMHDIRRLEVRVSVPEQDVMKADLDRHEAGDPTGDIYATFTTVPGRRFPLLVKEFETRADPVTQTFTVVLVMDNPPDANLLPGMTANVVWNPIVETGAAVTIPLAAIAGRPGDEPRVWVLDPGSMTMSSREVKVGEVLRGDLVRVLDGVSPGETIAYSGVHYLSEGQRVTRFQ